jgi:hypothetical protein
MFQKELALRGSLRDSVRRSLRVARGAAAALGTAMKFLENSAPARIGLPSIVRVDVAHNLVAVVVHLNFAVRTNHFAGLSHNSHPCLRASAQGYLFTPLAKCLCHPDEFLQELVDAPDVGLIEEFTVLGKHFLHAREIHVPENRNQANFAHDWQ